MFGNKRGDVFQLIFLIIILLIAAVVGILFLKLGNEMTNTMEEQGLFDDAPNAQLANDTLQAAAPRTTDYMIFFLFLGSVIGLLISASRTRFSPTIMFLFITLLIITIFVASGAVNIYSGLASSPELATENAQLTLTGFILSRYTPLIMTVIGGLIMIIMWGKSGGDILT